MKIKVIKKSENKFSWSNSNVGKIFDVIGEREKGHYDNNENEDIFIVDLKSINKNFMTGFICKSQCEIIKG